MFPEIWCVAIRKNENDGESILNGTEKPFIVLPNTKSMWCADPFLFEKEGRLYVFFEVLDYMKRKGLLGYREVTESGFGDIKVIYEGDSHLSFPFIYEENGTVYIIPESFHSSKLFRLKCTEFPDSWEIDKTFTEDKLVDTVMLERNGTRYYISQRVEEADVFNRVDLFYEENGELKECAANPVKLDLADSRGAGKVFEHNGELIRPSQDCSASYGSALYFNRITRLDKNGYEETPVKTVFVHDINTDVKREFCGIHTYNRLGNYEVIDLKLPAKFNLRNSVGAFIKLFKR